MTATERALDELCQWASLGDGLLDEGKLAQLARYLDTLLLWNRKMALVSQENAREIVRKHYADSLMAATYCQPGEQVVDLGTGAGFPGLPIAIVRPDVTVCLIESKGKKVSFLREAIRSAGITNTAVFDGRIERASAIADHAGGYTLVISRALAGLTNILELSRPFLQLGGRAIAMKGPGFQPELDALDWQRSVFSLSEVVRYRLPDSSKRVLVIASLGR